MSDLLVFLLTAAVPRLCWLWWPWLGGRAACGHRERSCRCPRGLARQWVPLTPQPAETPWNPLCSPGSHAAAPGAAAGLGDAGCSGSSHVKARCDFFLFLFLILLFPCD